MLKTESATSLDPFKQSSTHSASVLKQTLMQDESDESHSLMHSYTSSAHCLSHCSFEFEFLKDHIMFQYNWVWYIVQYPFSPKFRTPKNQEFRKILRFSMTSLLLKIRNLSIFYDQPSPKNQEFRIFDEILEWGEEKKPIFRGIFGISAHIF